jgi:HPt (histidine-containing phosphotransfer) domain-containing protein
MASVEEELAALVREYAAQLPGKIAEIDAAVAALRAGGDGALERARLLAHRLGGTAGSYGFQQVGDAAMELERAIVRMREGEGDLAAVEAASALVGMR